MFTKKVTVPVNNATQQIDAIQLWEVRWTSRYGEYSYATRPEMEAFPSEEEDNRFAQALRNAFALIRHTSGNAVGVYKAKAF